ncbi:MAG: metallophosphoesterase [Clostridia bacterium]|nr:metallophosphoesterase [Clostridia bacterium]
MLLENAFSKLMFKILSLILSAYVSLFAPIVPPSADEPIKPLNEREVKLVFAALADTQVSNYLLSRYPVFVEAMQDLHSAQYPLDAVLVAGDIVENGLAEEYQLIYDGLSGIDTRYILAEGNHDIRLRSYKQASERFFALANALNNDESIDSFHFSETINGYKFVVLGSDRTEFEESYLSDEQIDWLKGELEEADGEPTFVIAHQPLKNTHGLPETWGSPVDSAGSIGAQSDALKDILTSYKNVVFITGHLHTGFGRYTYETLDGLHMVNLPSLTINNKDCEYAGPGIGYIVEVYEDEIIFRARDFAKGKWVSNFDFTIPLNGGQKLASAWIKGYKNSNSAFSSTAATSDGGMIAVGSSMNGSSSAADIVRYGADGTVLWSDSISGDETCAFNDVAVLPDGSITAVGYTFEDAEGKGAGDCLIVKYSANGEKLLEKVTGGTNGDMLYSVAPCPDGGVVAGGMIKSTDGDFSDIAEIDNSGQTSAVLIKYADSDFSQISWMKSMTSSRYACVEGLAVAKSGDVFASIDVRTPDYDFENIPDKDIGSEKTLVVKYSADGAKQWQSTLCSSAKTYMPSITAGDDGGCVVAGYYSSAAPSDENNLGSQGTFSSVYNGGNAGSADGAVVALGSDGKVKWLSVAVGFYNDFITDIVRTSDGYVITGYSNSTNRDFAAMPCAGDYDAFICTISSFGTKQNLLAFGGSDADKILSACLLSDGSIGFCGSTASGDGDFGDISPAGSADASASFAGKAVLNNNSH